MELQEMVKANGLKSIYQQRPDSNLWQQLFHEEACRLVPGFAIDDNNKAVIEKLCWYLGRDCRFERDGQGSLKKGIYLAGCIGSGKTVIMKTFFRVIECLNNTEKTRVPDITEKPDLLCYQTEFRSTSQIVGRYVSDGLDGIKQFYGGPNDGLLVCFDDFGDEPTESAYMGNRLNVMKHIVTTRYERGVKNSHTFFTSNLNPEQVEEVYGSRIKSRLREMVNFVELKGGDRRK